MNARPTSLDALATRAKIAVIVPATNTIVQPEMEAMRPVGVSNHVSRMLLPVRPYDDMQAYRQALETEKGNLEEALNLVLPCEPHAVAHGHSIHSFRGDRVRALAEQERLEQLAGIPFVTPSMAVLNGSIVIRPSAGVRRSTVRHRPRSGQSARCGHRACRPAAG